MTSDALSAGPSPQPRLAERYARELAQPESSLSQKGADPRTEPPPQSSQGRRFQPEAMAQASPETPAKPDGRDRRTEAAKPNGSDARVGSNAQPPNNQAPAKGTTLAFPESAWRGIFAGYREAMRDATEASDVFHFATLWARIATALGRKIWFSYGLTLYPNVYLLVFGPTNDRKTTAIRGLERLGGEQIHVIRGSGSGEGIADDFEKVEPGNSVLVFSEEFAGVLRRGRWDGATLLPFLTECFDCPPKYELKFRKKPVAVDEPTPCMLAATTPDWFWRDARPTDFAGGFGNRIFYLTGPRKNPIPLPTAPELRSVSRAVDALSEIKPQQVILTKQAATLWRDFYMSWDADRTDRTELLESAVARIPSYILKLSMAYAATEDTLPQINLDQLSAAIQVGHYGLVCARELLSLQNAGSNPVRELEKQIVALVGRQPDRKTTKRTVYKSLHRHYSSTEQFNRAFDSLVKAGELFTKPMPRGGLLVSDGPIK